jgi:hypothetical protein
MRHGKLDLTMNVYTDPKLLDVRRALDVLPTLPLDGGFGQPEVARPTGTEGALVPAIILPIIGNPDNRSQTGPIAVTASCNGEEGAYVAEIGANGTAVKSKGPLTCGVNGPFGMGATGLEPVTPSVSSKGPSVVSGTGEGLTASNSTDYTPDYSTKPEIVNSATLDALAAALLGLAPGDRARLVALLLSKQTPPTETR